jgi:Flp pilus assembly protein TadG
MSFSNRPRRGRRGAAMIEFGLTFTLFMVFFIATAEGARLMWAWASLAHATREGARYAMVHGEANMLTDSDNSIEDTVKANAIGLEDADITVAAAWADFDRARGTQVEVDSTYTFRFIVGGITNSQALTLRSRSRVSIAN